MTARDLIHRPNPYMTSPEPTRQPGPPPHTPLSVGELSGIDTEAPHVVPAPGNTLWRRSP